MKKEKIKVLILTISMALVTLLSVGCTATGSSGCSPFSEKEIMEDGYFQYIIVGENGPYPITQENTVIAIVGFTASGKEQEVIDIPREIDGKQVRHIGYIDYSTFMDSFYHLESANLKKVYVHNDIVSVFREAFSYWEEENISLEIMSCGVNGHNAAMNFPVNSRVFVYREVYEQLRNAYEIVVKQNPSDNFVPFEDGYYRPANIVFMNNYSDEVNRGYYRLDNIETNEKIPEPVSPVRSGYEFIGWYTEAECVTAWDFDVSPAIKDDTEFRLYAGWRAL